MSFGKSAFIFVSGMVVGAASLTAFAGYKAFKMLKKNKVLYSAVEASVKAGVETASSEMSNRVAKMGMDFIFGKKERKPRFGDSLTYDRELKKWNTLNFKTEAGAQSVKESMIDLAATNGGVTVIDFNGLSGEYPESLYPFKHYGKHYGWTFRDIVGARIIKNGDGGWNIDLPRPQYLEKVK